MTTIDAPEFPDPPELERIWERFHGDIALDIGANAGQTARRLAPRFEVIYSFEPCREAYEVLEATALGLPNVHPVPEAVTDHQGSVVLDENADHLRRGQLTTATPGANEGHGWGQVTGQREVDATTVDAFMVTEWMGTKVDLLKIDVEGHEVRVLRGATSTLDRHHPALWIEIHGRDLGLEVVGILQAHGYGPIGEPGSGYELELIRHPNYQPGAWGWENHYWIVTP